MLVQEKKINTSAGRQLSFDRILLTGFRATGKSLVGRLLADRLGLGFLDTDTLLERRFGCSLSDFVAEHGWDLFRHQEDLLLQELSERTGVVLATGGGAILHSRTWQTLRRQSVSIWLQADEQTIKSRLATDVNSERQRPSLTGLDPCGEISTLLDERDPLYERGSDFAVCTDDRLPRELVEDVEQGLKLLTREMNNI